ncbi:Sec-independent protein translocase protein TatB [Marinomonas pollencensis]|uniref:Sec-independent protein translocase protein TatB n=1 Tax=Marinomonas pollencensis TaxID=491954 RepID=A0A3E0DKT1_9GAMM|nr:Sec-independent protein translocase protein TatB [Marinomonas pollencensis]REG82672.1 Sec-independent protein translocase TatB [Marinomonas pollencensis]
MFDIGFSELLVVFVVALIILGPERLPTAAKTAGLWVRKIRRSISSVQREINAQLDQEELQQKISQTNQRIMKEGNDIQNMITPLPESALAKQSGEQHQQANPEHSSPASSKSIEQANNLAPEAPTTMAASTATTGTSDSTAETSRS